MERTFDISLGEIYHIYNRGVDKRIIFKEEKDKKRFIKLLYLCNNIEKINFRDFSDREISDIKIKDRLVAIGAYCLMDNHFHLILKESTEGGISKFMEKLSTAYAMYFNKRYKRTGTLFENRFKAKYCGCDTYLKYLFSYIHLNPVKLIDSKWREHGLKDPSKAKSFLKNYKFSSFNEYFFAKDKRQESLILEKSAFPEYFKDSSFEKQIDFWMRYKDICDNIFLIFMPIILPLLDVVCRISDHCSY